MNENLLIIEQSFLIDLNAKKMSVEKKLEETMKENVQLKSVNVDLRANYNKITNMYEQIKLENNQLKRAFQPSLLSFKRYKKPYFELKSKMKKKRYKNIHETIDAINETVATTHNLQFFKIEMVNRNAELKPLQLFIDEFPRPDVALLNTSHNCLLAKDENFIADKKYYHIT
jgi:predicted nuclease with TOPRIM domain